MISKKLKPKIQEFKNQILKANKILIVSHKHPDGDAVGSCLALRLVLRALGKEVEVAMLDIDQVSAFSFLPHFFKIKDGFAPQDFDLAVILDCGGWSRTGFFAEDELIITWPEVLVIIDHHHRHQSLSPGVHLITAEACSTAEILFYIFQEWGVALSKDVALCLLTGLSTDTGSFKHSNTTQEVLSIAAELLTAGADMSKITQHIYQFKLPSQLRLWGRAIDKIKYNSELGLVSTTVLQTDINACSASENDLNGVIDLMNGVVGSKAALLLSERGEELKGSLRTEEAAVDVSRLAAIFGGGGHVRAAGFSIPKNILPEITA